MIIELLTFVLKPGMRDLWLERDARIWTPALQRTPGFLAKEVWVDRLDPDRALAAIWWRTREEWAAFPQDLLERLDSQMGDLTVSLTGSEYDVDGASYAAGLLGQAIAGKLAQTDARYGTARADFTLALAELLRDLRAVKTQPQHRADAIAGLQSLAVHLNAVPIDQVHEAEALDAALMWVVDAAEATDDPVLIAHARLMCGLNLLVGAGLSESLPMLKDSYTAACRSGDARLEYDTLRNYSFYVAGTNLAEALDGLKGAHVIGEARVLPTLDGAARTEFLNVHADLENRLGVILFDHGQYGEARSWLERSYQALAHTPNPPLNFLCQLYIAIGAFEDAERLLKPLATRTTLDHNGMYDLSLLGKLYIEWDRPEDAAALLDRAWTLARATGVNWLLTLVGNYQAELYLTDSFAGRSAAQGDAIAAEVVGSAESSGWNRSKAQALALRVRAALMDGDVPRAVQHSRAMIAFFESFGTLPAVRSEEITFTHAQALRAAGDPDADAYAAKARAIVEAKAATLDDADRERFLTRVPLNRMILANR